MGGGRAMADRQLTAALAGSAAATAAVPSVEAVPAILGARPWRWVVHTDSLDLFADRSRRAVAADPTDRLTLISCGDALHRARVALAADGLAARVTLLPDADPDHVASVTAPERIDVTDQARTRYEATELRPADRRQADHGPEHGPADLGAAADARPPATAIAALVAAAADEGMRLRLLDRHQVIELAAATSVTRRAQDRIRQDDATVYGVLEGDGDSPHAWLRAGEALSAVWLEASQRGLSIVPSTAVVEIPASRKVIRRLIPSLGTPYLAIRIGVSELGPPTP